MESINKNIIGRNTMNCALLFYQGQYYLLPMLSISELISVQDFQTFCFDKVKGAILGEYNWHGTNLPLVSLDLSLLPAKVSNPKIAILHALFENQKKNHLHIAVLFEGTPRRLKISSEQLTWIDEKSKRALLHLSEDLEVIVLDIQYFSKEIEKYL